MAEPINTNEQSDREFDLTIKLDERLTAEVGMIGEQEYSCGYNTVSGAFHRPGCSGECGIMNPSEAVKRRRIERRKAKAKGRAETKGREAGTWDDFPQMYEAAKKWADEITPWIERVTELEAQLAEANARAGEIERQLSEADTWITELKAALQQVEWETTGYPGRPRYCPWCRRLEKKGHLSDCARQSALRQSEGE